LKLLENSMEIEDLGKCRSCLIKQSSWQKKV
jgi:hypothetical protein